MRILFLLTQDMESPAGAGRYFPLARGLVKLGHQVTIAALHADFRSLRETRFAQKGVDIWYVNQMHVLKKDNRKLYFPAHQLLARMARSSISLCRAVLHLPADIVHVGKPHPMNSIAGLLARYWMGKTVFLDCDDLEVATSHFSNKWQRWGVQLFEDGMPRRVQHVTTHTYYLRDRMVQMGILPNRITYLPNGVDKERFAAPELSTLENLNKQLGLQGHPVVAFIGSLSLPSHPVDLLLESFTIVKKALPDCLLLIVGGGEEYDRLVKQVKEMSLWDSTIFTGRIPAAQVPLYYRLANVVVDPVIDNEVGRSRLPLKMFESWAADVPFVTADVGDRKLVIGDPPAGLLAKPGDPLSLAQALLQVLTDPEQANALRQAGSRRADEYDWDCLARHLESAYLSYYQPQSRP